MKARFLTWLVVSLLAFSLRAETYFDCLASGLLPQGGSSISGGAGVTLRAGTYLTELSALEISLGAQTKSIALGADLLVHAAAWSLYDRFFGYSAFDPFVTLGAKGWIAEKRGTLGPSVGLGAFYHLSDNWSFRCEAEATLGLDRRVEMDYSVSVGLHYAF